MASAPPAPLLGPLLARGATAEVFSTGGDRVIKLLLPGRPRAAAAREAALGQLVNRLGIPAPQVHDLVEIDGRHGVIFERIDGPSMLDAIVAQPWRVLRLAPLLGTLHARIHRAPLPADAADGPELRRLTNELDRKIGQFTHTPPDERAAALEQLMALKERGAASPPSLCHGDFHPGNVILTARGPVVVDWNDATLGPPEADVARTGVLMLHGELPAAIGGAKRVAIQTTRRLLHALYLRRYRTLTGMSDAQIEPWRFPTIVARRAEGVGR
ncbi:MAG TPA: aminoglycoside phosphotransferase family protein [Chloroflexota bacterium]|nr:aminoglycoside phosphotransferase family protein [Chloroflexota bacterium]